MQSSRSRLMLVALFGVLALGAFTAAAAQAVEAPRWSITGTALAAGKTHFITAKAYSTTLTLIAATGTIKCTGLNLKAGSLLGSAPESAGKNNEAIEFTGCKVEGPGFSKCSVLTPTKEVILTNPLRSELVETEKAEPANKKGSLLTLFEPEVAPTFVTLKFTPETGGTCPVKETAVTGSVAGQVLTDPEKPPELGTLVELGQAAKEATSWLVNFPAAATAIKRVTRINGGIPSEKNIGLNAFSEPAVLEGTALTLLAKRNAKGELESEATKWSPLP
jgi:hypothetical protein